MRKVYSFLALIAMFVMGATGLQAQVYYEVPDFGETSAAVAEFEVGGQYVLQTASAAERDFFAGINGKTSIPGETSVYTFVEAGEEDGLMTYYLQDVNTGLYLADGSVNFVDSKARAFRFWACHPTESLSKDNNEEPSDPDAFRTISVYDQEHYGGPVDETTAWIFTSVSSTSSSYTYFAAYWKGMSASFWSYRDTNTWYVYKAEKLSGYGLLEAFVQDKFPNGTVEGVVKGGISPGDVPLEKVDALADVLAVAVDVLNKANPTEEECNAVAKQLYDAYNDCLNSRIPIQEGYFLFHCSARQTNAYMYESSNNGLYTSTFDVPETADEWTIENASRIFQLVKADEGFYIKNFATGRYLGSVATSTRVNSTADADVAYQIIDSPVQPGAYAIAPSTASTSSYYFLHQDGSNNIVGWEAKGGASVWYIEGVADDVVAALAEQVEQSRLNAELVELYNDAVDVYAGAFKYNTDATPDGYYDDLGLVSSIWSNASDSAEGTDGGQNLLDADATTFWHSDWHGAETLDGGEFHNLEVELSEAVETFAIKYTARPQNKNAAPLKFRVYGTNDLTVEDVDGVDVWTSETWADQGTLALTYDYSADIDGTEKANWVGIASMKMDQPYKYLRFDAISNTGGSKFFNLSEFHVYAATLDAENSVITTIPAEVTAELLKQTEAAKVEVENEAATKETVDALRKAYEEFLSYYPDPSVLAALLEHAKAQVEGAVEGDKPGYFEAGASAALSEAISAVEADVLDANGEMKDLLTVAQLNAAQSQLEAALDAFFAKLVKPTNGAYYRIRCATTGAAANNYVYSQGNGETALRWGGADDANLAGDLRYIWKAIALEDGTYAFQNLFSGNYMGKTEQLYSYAINMSYEPQGITLESAQVAGVFNLCQGYDANSKQNIYANSSPQGGIVTWHSHSGNDNSSFEFVPEDNDPWLTTQVISISDDYAHILTVPFAVDNAGDDPIYAVSGIRYVSDTEAYIELEETRNLAAGVPFVVVRPEGSDIINLFPTAQALEDLEWTSADQNKNGLYGALNGFDGNEDIWVIYSGVVVRGGSTETVAANSGYFVWKDLPTVEAKGDFSIKLDDGLVGVSTLTLQPATSGTIYDLSGRRVMKAQKGLYIIGGKKVLVK